MHSLNESVNKECHFMHSQSQYIWLSKVLLMQIGHFTLMTENQPRFFVYFGGNLIQWASKKQTIAIGVLAAETPHRGVSSQSVLLATAFKISI